MNDLESKLQAALRRKEAPADFARMVMAKLRPSRASRLDSVFGFLRLRPVRWASVGALAFLVAVAVYVHDRQEKRARAEGELAKAQAITALRIASAELNSTLAKIAKLRQDSPSQ
jgi:hypothetical protein